MTTATAARAWRPLSRRGRVIYGVAGLATAAILAELVVRVGILNAAYVPPPSDTLVELGSLVISPDYWVQIGLTLQGWAIGLLLATVISIPLAILISSVELLRRATRPIIEFLRPVPSVGLLPVAILLLGAGLESKVFLIAFSSIWPLLVQTSLGLRDIDPTQLTAARVYRVSLRQRILRVVLPNALPYVATGFRISATTALIVGLTAELVIGSPGLGHQVAEAQAGNAIVLMYALITTTGLLGLLINILTMQVEKRALHWHPSHREVVR